LTQKKGGQSDAHQNNNVDDWDGSGRGVSREQRGDSQSNDRRRVKIAESKARGAAKGMQKLKKQLEEERRKINELQRNGNDGGGESRHNYGGQHDPASGDGQAVTNKEGGESNE
jgi:hypothetical protein